MKIPNRIGLRSKEREEVELNVKIKERASEKRGKSECKFRLILD